MSQPDLAPVHAAHVLEQLFNATFGQSHSTRLSGGCDEPLYQPAAAGSEQHTIFYTLDYFASALHEVAHWCVAGPQRRQQEDYGYWYAPDGRSAQQQAVFEQVEIKPQAMEWLFSAACGYRFRVSADNLQLGCGPSIEFKCNIARQAQYYVQCGIPLRADLFCQALARYFGGDYRALEQYNLASLA